MRRQNRVRPKTKVRARVLEPDRGSEKNSLRQEPASHTSAFELTDYNLQGDVERAVVKRGSANFDPHIVTCWSIISQTLCMK